MGKITAEEISRQPVDNVLTALEGRIPGLYIRQLAGIPGSQVDILLRGRNSLGSGNSPLFIVDGVPIVSETMTK